MIVIEQKGNFKKLSAYFERVKGGVQLKKLQEYGKRGVKALSEATPKDTGLTADSWYYTIEYDDGLISLNFNNSNLSNDWFPVAIYLQLGHATGNGSWVEGIDYINPALAPIFNDIAKEAWKEVRKT